MNKKFYKQKIKGIDLLRLLLLIVVVFLWLGGSSQVMATATATATATVTATTDTAADVEFNPRYVIEGVECEGNKKTKCPVISHEYYQSVGENVDFDEIQNAKLRLDARGLFDDVDISLKKGSLRGNVIVVIKVEEGTDIKFALNAGYGRGYEIRKKYFEDNKKMEKTYEGTYLEGKVSDLNFLGKGKILSATVLVSSSKSYPNDYYVNKLRYTNVSPSVLYTDPHLLDSKKWFLNFGLGSYYSKYRVDGYIRGASELGLTNNFELGWRFADFSYISLEQNLQWVHRISRVGQGIYFHYGWNSENDHIIPTEGSVLSTGVKLYDNYMRYFKIGKYLDIYSNYIKHHALNQTNILSFQFANNFSLRYFEGGDTHDEIELMPSLGCKYTNIFKRDFGESAEFKSAAWYINPTLRFNITNTGRTTREWRPTSYALDGGIIMDTSSWTVKLSLMLELSYPQYI
ncbi:MAG: hypothetical protein HQK49_06390 [Oligoflexia bacterium]|nr:hypothetical protein [Oligoflexia bacterium]